MIGRIIKGIGGFYYVKVEDEIIECKARGKFRHNELTPLVGDKVEISIKSNKGVIEKILPRSNELIRPNVANVTQAFVVFSIKSPDINMDLLNKFLVLCESKNLKITICINKKDLADEQDKAFVESYFGNIGYEYYFIEAKNNHGIDELKRHLANNVTVVCGPSGVGKSTLINKLCGNDVMAIGQISEKNNRGKHTTRHSQLIDVEGGFILDTPGFSSLDITIIKKDELQYCFPEFQDYNEGCKFKGCLHYKEPNCAVKNAVDKEIIHKDRYDSYIAMLEELIQIKPYN